MQIRLARKSDYPAVVELLKEHGKFSVTRKHLNHRDISVIVYADTGECIGYLYCGLMAGNSVAYMDKFTIHSSVNGQHLGHKMALFAVREGLKRGVREIFGIIKQDAYHDKSAVNALKVGIGSDKEPYTYVRADLRLMVEDLKQLQERF